MLEIIPLRCPQCEALSHRSLAWVHENSRVTCDRCGAGFPIDKDRLVLWLAEQERNGDRDPDPPPYDP